ncbi:MAG: alkaline phosphatase family protein, partial [Saprospiraceae bacterium]
MRVLYFVGFLILQTALSAQNQSLALLKSGPMMGPVTLRDAAIWVQTTKEADVQILYRSKNSKTTFEKSMTVRSKGEDGYTCTIHLVDLKPSTKYEYQVLINKVAVKRNYPLEFVTQTHWQYRTDPPDFSFIAASCFYINDTEYDRPGESYGNGYGIIKSMYDTKPDFMVWLGDNTYLREGDFESRSGIYYRQAHTRALLELQPFLASQPHYAIWDDHD